MKPEQPGESTDAIIVLTGGKNRIESGLQIFSQKAARHLFVTGVNEQVTRDDILSRYKGTLPDCCITLGYKANSTAENAAETRDWIKGTGYKTVRLVTSNYHMPRALLEFRHALPGVTIIPNPVTQPGIMPKHEYFWRLLVIEYHKTIFRFFEILAEKFS